MEDENYEFTTPKITIKKNLFIETPKLKKKIIKLRKR